MSEYRIEDQVLGCLVWNSELEWWSSQIEILSGQSINVSISPEDTDPSIVFQRVRHTMSAILEVEVNLRRTKADKLLNLYNTTWNDGLAINQEEFINRITLDAIAFSPDGSANLYYSDGDLFWGHTIITAIDTNGCFQDTMLTG